jgi:carboxymethylenebutenolidase
LTAADGTRVAAFAAHPDADPVVGIVVLPDVRGLYRYYTELALRFGERGYAAIAIDYYGRSAGLAERGDEFEYLPHLTALTPDQAQQDIGAAVAWLRDAGCRSSFTVGCCLGGRSAWLSAAGGHGLAGAVGFYGVPGEMAGVLKPPSPIERAGEMTAPILALQAGDDPNISAEMNAEFERALESAGVEHELVTYDGAPHSFFDRRYEEFADECADAWSRTLAFIEQHAAD